MSVVAEKTQMTPEEFLRMPDQKDFELIDGELVSRDGDTSESRLSILSSWVGDELFGRIRIFLEDHPVGWIFPADAGFQCFPERPKTIRKPDIAFIKLERMDWDQLTDGWLRIVPDLVVEVVSPNDLAYEVDEKIEMFLQVGVPLIWVIYPTLRLIRVIRADGTSSTLRDGNELSGNEMIPGFSCLVSSLFRPRKPISQATVRDQE